MLKPTAVRRQGVAPAPPGYVNLDDEDDIDFMFEDWPEVQTADRGYEKGGRFPDPPSH